jgi:DNA helicase II / ATP-dependent DNA helicase PcrA
MTPQHCRLRNIGDEVWVTIRTVNDVNVVKARSIDHAMEQVGLDPPSQLQVRSRHGIPRGERFAPTDWHPIPIGRQSVSMVDTQPQGKRPQWRRQMSANFTLTNPIQKKSRAAKPSKKAILKGLNPEQSQATQHPSGPLGVFAGAGSGKTRVLTHRIALLTLNGQDPLRILAVTFSKKASLELTDRLGQLGCSGVESRTWHSLALWILRDEGMTSGWKIENEKDDTGKKAKGPSAKLLLKNVLGWKGMDWKGADLGSVQSYIGFCKSQLWDHRSAEALEHANGDRRLVEAYRQFELELQRNRLITFDCMLFKACRLLSANEDVRARWASKFDHLLQDEAQDANPAQMTLAELLVRDHRNYMVVGDPSQAIYAFRGSRPESVMEFAGQWPGATVLTMNRNYRCGHRIVEAANEVIRPATCRLPEDLIAEGGWEGGISHEQHGDLDDEAEAVAEEVQRSYALGHAWEDSVVLFRTNAQSRALEEAFLGRKIPHLVVGGSNFYDRREVAALLGYLRIAVGRADADAIRRAINIPFRFIGVATLDKVSRYLTDLSLGDVENACEATCNAERLQRRQRSSLMEFCSILRGIEQNKNTNPGDLLNDLERRLGFIEWLLQEEGAESLESSHAANVKELIRVAGRFESVDEFLNFVDETTLKAEKAKSEKANGRVLLMTVHKSKGLEFPFVHVVGVVETILPHAKGELEEERRLFYVAITRAAQHCYLHSPRSIATRAGVKDVAISRFVPVNLL